MIGCSAPDPSAPELPRATKWDMSENMVHAFKQEAIVSAHHDDSAFSSLPDGSQRPANFADISAS